MLQPPPLPPPIDFEQRWETIGDNSERLKVPGGWVVRSWKMNALHQVFVADPAYTWKFAS